MDNKVLKNQPNMTTRMNQAAMQAGIDEGLKWFQEWISQHADLTKEADSPWVKEFKAKLDGKDKTKQQPVEKGPPLAPHYPGVGVPPIYQAPSTEKQKDKSRLDITDRFYLANQNYSKRTRRL